jgi:hypothetical protein
VGAKGKVKLVLAPYFDAFWLRLAVKKKHLFIQKSND